MGSSSAASTSFAGYQHTLNAVYFHAACGATARQCWNVPGFTRSMPCFSQTSLATCAPSVPEKQAPEFLAGSPSVMLKQIHHTRKASLIEGFL